MLRKPSLAVCGNLKFKSFNHQTVRYTNRHVLAIRRETINVWERRAPLSPAHVGRLVKKNVKVIVQPSNRRAYNMQEYSDRGAIIREDISEASTIIGVKQVPEDNLMPNKTYAFFSHTIKAQEANMPLLDAILEKNICLIDYEKMVDSSGNRVVAFGKYAGVSGMVNILHGLGLRLLALGHHTPFMHIGPSHNYRNSEMARQAIRDAGYEIALGRMPPSIGPLTFVFTGTGNVSQGAQEVFQELPHEYVEPEYLPTVSRQGATNKVYVCVVSREDHYVRKDGGKFNAEEFEHHPERFASTFSHKIAPYTSCLVNGIYWAVNSPRLITIPDAKVLLRRQDAPWLPDSPGCPQLPHRLLAICDISADPGGSIEFMKECTTIDKPFCLYDAEQNMETESFAGSGVLICSIDNMPAQMPREATDFFGSLLLPQVEEMLKCDAKKSFEDLEVDPVVKNAVITSNGKLTSNFEYIADMRASRASVEVEKEDGRGNHMFSFIFKLSHHKTASKRDAGSKGVLLLGAGYVCGPVVEYLSRTANIQVTVVSELRNDLDRIVEKHPDVNGVLMDVQRSIEDLEKLIPEHDVVVSLLPYFLHPEIAKLCIKHKKNMVTASYVSPAMQNLHKDAVDAGITIMNEVGVDPGLDHMLAIECFDEVKHSGGKISSFESWCGGLPAPEFSDTPLLYRFSWFPKGVLMNCLSGAKYLKDGKVIEIPSGGGLLDSAQTLNFLPGFSLEGYPNRDSTEYSDLYEIQNAQTILRGTLRYQGFSNVAKGLLHLNLLNSEPHPRLHPNGPDITWKGFICDIFGKSHDLLGDSLKDLVYEEIGSDDLRLKGIVELGLLDDEPIDKKNTPVDTLSHYLSKRLTLEPGQRDLIIMRHDIGIDWLDGSKQQTVLDLVVYGDSDGFSAMAKTVGYPTAITTKMIIEGEIQKKGVVRPFSLDTYKSILSRLKQEGITHTEKVKNL